MDRRRDRFGVAWAAGGLVACGAVALWGRYVASDPEFALFDPFPLVMAGTGFSFAVSLAVPWRRGRLALRATTLLVLVACVTLELRGYPPTELPTDHGRLVRSEDPLLRWHFRPGGFHAPPGTPHEAGAPGDAWRFNSRGLWDREYEVPKPEGTIRVAVLGDSVPTDPRVAPNDRFVRVLERRLRVAWGPNVEVINVACEGFNTEQEVRFFRQVALDYDPDLVVVAYVLNDPYPQDMYGGRDGHSLGLYRLRYAFGRLEGRACRMFAELHETRYFDLIVGNALDRLSLLGAVYGFETTVAALPVFTEFDDPVCQRLYDQVGETAADNGMPFVRVVDAFAGDDAARFLRGEFAHDIIHPNAAAHTRIGDAIADTLIAAGAPDQTAPGSTPAPAPDRAE